MSDPFSSITKLPSRQSSPFDYQQRPFPTPTSTPSQLSSSQQPTNRPQTKPAGGDEEEWTFASALPEGSELPASNDVTVTNSAINVVFAVSRPTSGEHSLRIIAQFTNNTAQTIQDVTFQVAVTKVGLCYLTCSSSYPTLLHSAPLFPSIHFFLHPVSKQTPLTSQNPHIIQMNELNKKKGIALRLNPQSGRTLVPHQRSGITQLMHLSPVAPGSGNQVKVRWKLSYRIGGSTAGAGAAGVQGMAQGLGLGQGQGQGHGQGEVRMEEGEVSSLGVA